MTDDHSEGMSGSALSGDAATRPAAADTRTEWAVRFISQSSRYEFLAVCADEPAARREAEHPTRVAPPWSWSSEVVCSTVTTIRSPWQPPAGEATAAAQLASLVETAAETLRHAVSGGSLTGEVAATVADKLRAALDHIGETLSPAVSDALPDAAKHLDIAAARSMGAAHLIRLAEPAMSAGRPADRLLVAFPDDVRPAARVNGGAVTSSRGAERPQPPASVTEPAAQDNWEPTYSPWRHGGWYVDNVRYPGGAVGCVSRNYADRKWRIVCDDRPDAHEKYTYPNRDAAARAERELARARWERVAELAAGLAPVGGIGSSPNDSDAPCSACGLMVYAEQGVVVPGDGLPSAVLDSSCSAAISREQADPGGAQAAPPGYARHVGQAHRGSPQALAAQSFPGDLAAGLPTASRATASPGQSAHSTARRQQDPRATRGR